MLSMPLESSSCWERMFQRIGRPLGSGSRKQRSREISTGIFREQSQPPHPRGLRLTVDKKLWRKIREKKIAMGHKPDDHEEPTITM